MASLRDTLFGKKAARGQRLLTQNLLTSAASLERTTSQGWEAIHDFSLLVELFCLYDRAVVIGRGIRDTLRSMDSSLFALLEETNFISTATLDESEQQAVATAARQHLITFLGEDKPADYDELFRFALNAPGTSYALSYVPDRGEELVQGQEWLMTTPTREGLIEQLGRETHFARGTTFLVRTFLYLAYADIANLPFTPDTTRVPALGAVLDKEVHFRDKLLTAMSSGWQSTSEVEDPQLRRHFSPLAAVVIERAAPDWRNVTRQLKDLRAELTPLRTRLQKAEQVLLWGTHDASVKVQREWQAVHEELARSYGYEPNLVSIRRGVGYGEALGNLADNPTSYESWAKAVLSLPVETLSRMHARRPAIELHRLRRDLPTIGRLRAGLRLLLERHSSRR